MSVNLIESPPPVNDSGFAGWLNKLWRIFNIFGKEHTATGAHSNVPYLKVSTTTTIGKEALHLDQNDEDQAFLEVAGTSAADLTKNITTLVVGTTTGHILIEVNGAKRWVPFVTTPTI